MGTRSESSGKRVIKRAMSVDEVFLSTPTLCCPQTGSAASAQATSLSFRGEIGVIPRIHNPYDDNQLDLEKNQAPRVSTRNATVPAPERDLTSEELG